MDANNKSEEFKKNIDNIFKNIDDVLKSEKESQVPIEKTGNKKETHKKDRPKLKINKDISDARESLAIRKAIEELEVIRIAFLDFQEDISDLVLFPYLYEEVEKFGQACLDLLDIINDDFEDKMMTKNNKERYAELKNFRFKILNTILDNYEQDK